MKRSLLKAVVLGVLCFAAVDAQNPARSRRNVILFIADGLRPGSVNAQDTQALWSIRQQGVNFSNSHSLFPTFTMANASAIATGHGLGDTGTFSNYLWVGFPAASGSIVPFLENNQVLADTAARFGGNFMGETTLLAAASMHGYNTASIGKIGPAGLLNMGTTAPIVVDDATGTATGVPLPQNLIAEIKGAGLPTEAPTRSNGYGPTSPWNNGYAGTTSQPGTRHANVVQQQWFTDVATRVILPKFQRELPKPFLFVYWSRDPDGSQHNQGDSLGTLSPGINGDTSRLAAGNADRNLRRILDWLDSYPAIKANTDVFVTADHGFATISKREVAPGVVTASEVAKHDYTDATGNVDTARGTLPYGFLAIELALALQTNVFDADRRAAPGTPAPYRQLRRGPDVFERPALGSGLIGENVRKEDGSDAKAIVAANGGADLIYVPDRNPETVRQIVRLLTTLDYVGGVFVDDEYGRIPGALPLSDIGLQGASRVPRPAIVVALKVFYLSPGDLRTAVQISDSSQRHGQGMHGGLGRDSTFNNMAAIGPDFKTRYVAAAPVSNADIAPTIARILGFEMPSIGKLKGRVIVEALRGGPAPASSTPRRIESEPANGRRTILHFQEFGGLRYIDRGCFDTDITCPDAGTTRVWPVTLSIVTFA